jgi:hypothetical protein
MNQILLGAIIPFFVAFLVYICRKFRASLAMLITVPFAIMASVIWAIAPDLPRFFGNMELYYKLSFNPKCDIFLWHYSIDLVETDSGWYGVGLLAVIACMLFAAWREIRIMEKK